MSSSFYQLQALSQPLAAGVVLPIPLAMTPLWVFPGAEGGGGGGGGKTKER